MSRRELYIWSQISRPVEARDLICTEVHPTADHSKKYKTLTHTHMGAAEPGVSAEEGTVRSFVIIV